jgi:hypothetical protein
MSVFAILAAVVWFIAAMGWTLWDINLTYLALALLSLHLAFGPIGLPAMRWRRNKSTP